MKTISRLLSTVIICICTFIGCTDNDANPFQQLSVFTMDDYPMGIGARWTYSLHDTVADTRDTIDVLIYDSTRFPDDHYATVWIIGDLGDAYDLDFVSLFGDTLKFYRNRSGVPDRYLVFPIGVGNSWGFDNYAGHDTNIVAAKETVDVPFGVMTAWRIDNETFPAPLDLIRYSSIWLVPDVGLVRAEYTEGFRIVERHVVWELIEYLPSP